MSRLAFPKSSRLLTNSQFRHVFSRRLTARDGNLVLYARENDLGFSRLGISLSKSCGTAVVRNRLKRLIREAFRQNKDKIASGFDYVVTAAGRVKIDAKTLKFEEITDSLLTLVFRLTAKIT